MPNFGFAILGSMKKLSRLQIASLLVGPVFLLVTIFVLITLKSTGDMSTTPPSDDWLTEASPEPTGPTEVPEPLETQPPEEDSYDLTAEQKLRAEQLTSLFENGKIDIRYDYVENLDDGRGYTAGRAGFTTADGDAVEVVQLYTKLKPTNSLAKYLPVLQRLAKEGSDSVSELKGYEKAWRDSASVKEFKDAQDAIVTKLYYQPSKSYANQLGLKLAISRAFLYDTIIQHGDGKDGDSISALIKKTTSQLDGSPKDGVDEVTWLSVFIDIRKADLKNPDNDETKDVWKTSTGRCDVFKQILDAENYSLAGPIKIKTAEYKVTVP